jgi:hypothetical protein
MIRGLKKLNKFLEFLKSLVDLSDEQIEKAELELNKTEKTDKKTEDKPVEKQEEKVETKTGETVKEQSAGATSNTTNKDGEDTVDMKKYEALQSELKAMKEMLENTQAERVAEKRANKIKSVKNCVDYDVLTSLLEGVEDKDIDAKVAEIQKDKGYLFNTKETEGFNPATPQKTVSGVEAKFLELNPDLKGLI